MLQIDYIYPDSLAEEHGLKSGDIIISINNQEISDFLDLQFHGADDILIIKYKNRSGELKTITITQDWEKQLGIEPAPHSCRTCANNCIFCFVDQMRPDIRQSLYIKDDDYPLSFVFGNFITLTNLAEKDYQRIFQQKLSPMYVSVQTTNPDLHKKMLRYKHDFNIINSLKRLSANGIEMHTQIVVIPGWNDGKELERSLQELTSDELNVLSIGIVPVGLTKYRHGLTPLNNVDHATAKQILAISEKYPNTYCSDEIYLLANQPIPPEEFYQDYQQLENGIGMIRMMLENWKYYKDDFLNEIKAIKDNLIFVTGQLAFNHISKIANEISTICNNNTKVIPIKNNFLGSSVTVTGLLSAQDIISQVEIKEEDLLVISKGIFNDDWLTIDNIHIDEFKSHFNNKLLVIDEEFASWEFV